MMLFGSSAHPEIVFQGKTDLNEQKHCFISRAHRFDGETQIKGCLLPALFFLERTREINHNRYSWSHKT